MERINWSMLVTSIVITSIIVSILTEHAIIKKIKSSEGITFKNGTCTLENGYGKLA